jgi:hypothetical protein
MELKNKKRHGFKKLHRSDGIWQWKAGRSCVLIYSPTNQKIIAFCQDVANVGDWERARWKKYDQITPAMVEKWINSQV